MVEKKKKGLKAGQTAFLCCILALPVLQWLVFWLYVNVDTILLAFRDARTDEWTLQNFADVWESVTSPYGSLGIALGNTFKYFGIQVLTTFLCLFVAYFFYKKILGYKVFRIIFYFPSIISGVAMATAFKSFINPGGPLDLIMGIFDGEIPREGLLANVETATNTMLVYTIWVGFTTNVLLFGSAMSRVPTEVLESAALEGCGPIRELFQIIFPMIWSSISSVLVILCTNILTASGPILLFTNGEYNTTTLSFWIFSMVYGNGTVGGVATSYNLVSCAGLVFTAISAPIILAIRKLFEKIPTVEY